MNDDELNTTMRERFIGVRMDIPVEEIVKRGRGMRARRRLPVAAGTLAVTAGAALGIAALPPSAQPARVDPATLAAWSVVSMGHGNFRVTIRELRDPAGLQAKLRADGIPAKVGFSHPNDPACRQAGNNVWVKFVNKHHLRANPTEWVIHRSELRNERGVFMYIYPHGTRSEWLTFSFMLVHRSPACTG